MGVGVGVCVEGGGGATKLFLWVHFILWYKMFSKRHTSNVFDVHIHCKIS